MAYQSPTNGERLNIQNSCRPWRPVGSYTTPVKGHLVKEDTSGNGLVARCASGDIPLGMVWSVNNGNGVLSILEFQDNVIELEYTGTFAVGDHIVANGTTGTISIGGFVRDVIKRDNVTPGSGLVTSKDALRTGTATVRFG
jgi:hypothetical protein